jgi:uracil-DNA glycosylase family 4
MPAALSLAQLNDAILACRRCPRLLRHCATVAETKRAAYRNHTYHGGPVPNFISDRHARLLIVGLAPGAHGANRTGRMFTGDRSGDWLYRALHQTGFASQAASTHLNDGLQLIDCAITAAAHCAPPDNKPTPQELAHCAPFLEQTFALLPAVRVVVCLGRLALNAVLKLYQARGWIQAKAPYRFAHGVEFRVAVDAESGEAPAALLCSYHPSQQNTFTGRLTEPMLRTVFERARRMIDGR